MGSHVEHEHDLFIKRVSHVNPNMTQTRLASTHNLFINGLVVLGSRVVSNFATPTSWYGIFCIWPDFANIFVM